MAREHAADAYAGSLGQAVDLAAFLMDSKAAFDSLVFRLLADLSNHPSTEARVERLLPWFGAASP